MLSRIWQLGSHRLLILHHLRCFGLRRWYRRCLWRHGSGHFRRDLCCRWFGLVAGKWRWLLFCLRCGNRLGRSYSARLRLCGNFRHRRGRRHWLRRWLRLHCGSIKRRWLGLWSRRRLLRHRRCCGLLRYLLLWSLLLRHRRRRLRLSGRSRLRHGLRCSLLRWHRRLGRRLWWNLILIWGLYSSLAKGCRWLLWHCRCRHSGRLRVCRNGLLWLHCSGGLLWRRFRHKFTFVLADPSLANCTESGADREYWIRE